MWRPGPRPAWVDALNALGDNLGDSGRSMVSLREADLLAAASAVTGLDDWGDDWFRQGLSVLLRALEDEALIVETQLPEVRPYWNIQVNDPYFNAVEFVYRQTSINGHTARIDSDGRFRAVLAHKDPGVANWLDTGGFTEGTLFGRWMQCSSQPLPSATRVKLADIRAHLPADTQWVTPAEREEALRKRRIGAQLRRRW